MTRPLQKGYELIGHFATIQTLMELAILGDFQARSTTVGKEAFGRMRQRFRDDDREALVSALLTEKEAGEALAALQSFKELKDVRDLLGHGIPFHESDAEVSFLKLGGPSYSAHVRVLAKEQLDDALSCAERLRDALADVVSTMGWGDTPVHYAIRNLKRDAGA